MDRQQTVERLALAEEHVVLSAKRVARQASARSDQVDQPGRQNF
jgi:hypothetical protein